MLVYLLTKVNVDNLIPVVYTTDLNEGDINMSRLDKAIGGVDVIDVITSIVEGVKRKAAKPSGYETTIEINGYEYDCIVDYEIEKGCKGSRNEYGAPVEPDTHTVVNMGEVWLFDGQWNIVDIPEQCMTDTLNEILEEHR